LAARSAVSGPRRHRAALPVKVQIHISARQDHQAEPLSGLHLHRPAYLYRAARNLVERFFNKIKQCRRIATRYDKLAANYLAFIKLASIRIWLHAYESAP
jgi:transposase